MTLTGGRFVPKGHLALSGDIVHCRNSGGGVLMADQRCAQDGPHTRIKWSKMPVVPTLKNLGH